MTLTPAELKLHTKKKFGKKIQLVRLKSVIHLYIVIISETISIYVKLLRVFFFKFYMKSLRLPRKCFILIAHRQWWPKIHFYWAKTPVNQFPSVQARYTACLTCHDICTTAFIKQVITTKIVSCSFKAGEFHFCWAQTAHQKEVCIKIQLAHLKPVIHFHIVIISERISLNVKLLRVSCFQFYMKSLRLPRKCFILISFSIKLLIILKFNNSKQMSSSSGCCKSSITPHYSGTAE